MWIPAERNTGPRPMGAIPDFKNLIYSWECIQCDFTIGRPVGTGELLGSTICADRNISRSTNSEFMDCRGGGHEHDALE